ncbi:MAG TPA: DUF2334 domain-containing protein [Nitrososphaera sp.]|nr:DUF2334 domain-containing protein [Nitrososphaera sp.]
MKDVVTDYWLNYKMATIELGELKIPEHALKSKFAIVTIHDAAPAYSTKIFRAADSLERLEIPFGMAIIPKFRGIAENEIGNNLDWLERILDYGQPIVLHGLFHEDKAGKVEDFHNFTFEEAMDHLKAGLAMFSKAGLSTNVFIPPTWAVNKYTIDALNRSGFSVVETDEEILLLSKNTRLHCSILNWDRGSKQFNALAVDINRRAFREKILGKSQMVRLAIHPKDDERALADQVEIIRGLKDMNYNFLTYVDVQRLFG